MTKKIKFTGKEVYVGRIGKYDLIVLKDKETAEHWQRINGGYPATETVQLEVLHEVELVND